jgi:SAM-dependent methyltransferase
MRSYLHAVVAAEASPSPPLAPHYAIDTRYLPRDIARMVVRFNCDAETASFVEACDCTDPPSCCKAVAAALLRPFVSVTTANGMVGRGQMHVLSTRQFRTIVAAVLPRSSPSLRRLLDVGAGDGAVTAKLAPLFDEVVTTEVSASMVRSLRARRWTCLESADLAELLPKSAARYDVVSVLNVLDRCSEPRALLRSARALLAPRGVLLLAVVLPFAPFVERGPLKVAPREHLPVTARDFEGALAQLVRDVLAPAGFRVKLVSRVPYICKGDVTSRYFVISDAILACVRAGEEGGGEEEDDDDEEGEEERAGEREDVALLAAAARTPASLRFAKDAA